MENVKIDNKLDYSEYHIKSSRLLADVHDLLLQHKYEEASTKLLDTIVELRLCRAAVLDYKNRIWNPNL